MQEKGLATRSEGALIVDLEKYGLPPAMVEKSDGASLYFTREVANIEYRVSKYSPEKIIYVVGLEQSLHFQQLFKVADLLGINTELFHIGNGLVLGPDGKKLSTREGKTIFIEDIINKAISLTRKIVEEKNPTLLSEKEKDNIAQVVAIGALKYNDLSQSRTSNITFDWDKMLSFEGDSGPYLQYAYARLRSILRKAETLNSKPEILNLNSEAELNLILKLDSFPDVVRYAAENFVPNHLAKYLYNLSHAVNAFYHDNPVLNADPDVRNARLALIAVAAETLKTGLNLLGIETLEQM